MVAHTAKTFCRNCSHFCGLEIDVENNEMVGVRGDKNHLIGQGYHCIKASMSLEFGNGKTGRITSSQKRQPDGTFTPVAAEQAMDEIAEKISGLIDQHGPRSLGLFYGTASYFDGLNWPIMKSFLTELGSPNLFSTTTIDMSAVWVSIMRAGMMLSGLPKVSDVDTLMIAGKNPVVSHFMFGLQRAGATFAEFKKTGKNLIVIDPRKTETARYSSQHLTVRPGQDVPLYAGMIRAILENEWHDQDFCSKHCVNLDQLRQAVAPYTPELVAERTGLNWNEILQAAKTFATTKSYSAYGTGLTMAPYSNLLANLSDGLNIICGNYLRAGDRVKAFSLLAPRPYLETVLPPNRTWEEGEKLLTSPDIGAFFGEFPTGALPDEILVDHPERIRVLIVYGGNPAKAIVDPEKTLKAFKNLELLVVMDPIMNETAKLADYVIAPKLQYERHDITAVMDANAGFSKPFVQYAAPLLDPPPNVIGDGEFFWGLAKRLGVQLIYKKVAFGMDYKSTPNGKPMDMETMPDPEQLVRWWCEGSRTDYETLTSNPSGITSDENIIVQDMEDTGARLDLCPPDIARELSQALNDDSDMSYPYRMTNRRMVHSLNSMYHNSEENRRRFPTNYVYMNPEDMERESLKNGDDVTIQSPAGSIQSQVKGDKSMTSGVISMTHLWGDFDTEKGTYGPFSGALVSLGIGEVEPINRMPIQTAIPVRVNALGAAE